MTAVASVSAVFPCYNDETTIGGLIDDVYEALSPVVPSVEVIVVNDGSADASGAVLEPEAVAEAVVATIYAERFLVLPHPEVLEYWRRKTSDYDRWISGMRRLQASVRAS